MSDAPDFKSELWERIKASVQTDGPPMTFCSWWHCLDDCLGERGHPGASYAEAHLVYRAPAHFEPAEGAARLIELRDLIPVRS